MADSRIMVRRMESGDLPAAAGLLAAKWPGLPGFEVADDFVPLIESGASDVIEDSVVAVRSDDVRGDRVCGYICAERQLYAPADFASIYAEPRSIAIPLQGHAVDTDEDPAHVYALMYAALASDWVPQGLLVHSIGIDASDPRVLDAWWSLGFGQKSVCARRDTEIGAALAAEAELAAGVEVVSGDAHPDELHRLHRELMRYQRTAPMFWPFTGEQDQAVQGIRAAMISGQGGASFLARVAGQVAGMMVYAPPAFLSPLLVPPDTTYLWEAYVDPAFRGRRVGSRLLAESLGEMRLRGFEQCMLHWISGNPLGRRFWLNNGYRPVEHLARRTVDSRVLLADGLPGTSCPATA